MSELNWQLIRNHNAFMVRRSGVVFSREAGNLANKHSYKYSGLAQPAVICVTPTEKGVSVCRRRTKVPANKVAGAWPTPSVIKGSATGALRARNIARDLKSTGYRPDLCRDAKAKVAALLRSFKPRKNVVKKLRANKLAKLTKAASN